MSEVYNDALVFKGSAEKNYGVTLSCITHIPHHYHPDSIELVYCLEGKINLSKLYDCYITTIYAGDIIAVEHEDFHHFEGDGNNLVLIVHLDLKHQHIKWEKLKYKSFVCNGAKYPRQLDAIAKLRNLMLSIALIEFSDQIKTKPMITKQKEFSDKICANILDIMITYFDWGTCDIPDEYPSKETRDRIDSIQAYVDNHFTEKITLNDMAEYLHLSAKYCSHFFEKTRLEHFKKHLKYTRFYYACQLLITTDRSVEEVAVQTGFPDKRSVYNAFNEFLGCTPAQLRARYAEYRKQPLEIDLLENAEAFTVVNNLILDNYILRVSNPDALADNL